MSSRILSSSFHSAECGKSVRSVGASFCAFVSKSCSPCCETRRWYLGQEDPIQQTLKLVIERGQQASPVPRHHRCCPKDQSLKAKLSERLVRELTELPDEDTLEEISGTLRVLSHPLRLKMALLLLKRDHCVCELVQLTRKKPNLVSHHLASMRTNGIVDVRRKSGWKYYSLKEDSARLLNGCSQVVDTLTRTDSVSQLATDLDTQRARRAC